MDKRPQRLAKNTTALVPKNASCKRWDTLNIQHTVRYRGTRTIDVESPDFMRVQNQCLREIGSLILQ
jgi:hypothetical protein